MALASVAAHYGLGPVVSIDPHNVPSLTDPVLEGQSSSYDDFLATLRSAGIERQVEVHRASSRRVARGWNRPIRLLWIDGDHTYGGAKEDFDLFSPHLAEGSIVAFHDTLHELKGPFEFSWRIFSVPTSSVRRDSFTRLDGAQYRPRDGARFRAQRQRLARRANRLIPFVTHGRNVKGLSKFRYKLRRAMVPHPVLAPAEWVAKVSAWPPPR